MRILCVIQRYHPVIGGAEIYTKHLLDYLSKKNKVTVFTTDAFDVTAFWNKKARRIIEKPNLDYEVKRLEILTAVELAKIKNSNNFPIAYNYPGPFSPKMWKELVTKKINFDIIITTAFPYDQILAAFTSAKKWKIPIITIPLIHKEFPELYLNAVKLEILKNSDAIISLTNSEKKLLIENGIDSKKIEIIPPGIEKNIETIDFEKFKKENSIKSDAQVILFLGLKSKSKGVLTLIEAMKQVWKKQPNTVLILIGPSTPEFEKYFSKLDTNLKNKIINLDGVNETIKQTSLAICNVLVLPSKTESFGMVILEAWNFGKPVISCNIEPINEIIQNNKNGILVNFDKPNELSEAIQSLLENPNLCVELGTNGRIESKKYDWKNSCVKFEELCSIIVRNSTL